MPSGNLKPHLSEDELILFESHISEKKWLLEFGAGGSTKFALQTGLARVDSVESDPAWVEVIKQDDEIKAALVSGRLTIHSIELGAIGEWGTPIDSSCAVIWPNYYLDIWRRLDGRPDVVFIDGRFRVSCCLATLSECPKSTVIIIHDFWNRPQYTVLNEFVRCVARTETLAILERKDHINWRKMARACQEYALNLK